MTLSLTPIYRLHDLDAHNLVLQRLHTRTSGKAAGSTVWLTLGYHTTLESALLHAHDVLTRDQRPATLDAALDACSEASRLISVACEKIPTRPA